MRNYWKKLKTVVVERGFSFLLFLLDQFTRVPNVSSSTFSMEQSVAQCIQPTRAAE